MPSAPPALTSRRELVCVGGKVGMCNTRAEGGLPEDLANLT